MTDQGQRLVAKRITPGELEKIVAPIALYPDALLTRVLTAAVRPREIVQAAQFVAAHPGLAGDQLDEALTREAWDESVKSLVAYPQVLAMMHDKLDWTGRLGDAFGAQPEELMDAVRRLRAAAALFSFGVGIAVSASRWGDSGFGDNLHRVT